MISVYIHPGCLVITFMLHDAIILPMVYVPNFLLYCVKMTVCMHSTLKLCILCSAHLDSQYSFIPYYLKPRAM